MGCANSRGAAAVNSPIAKYIATVWPLPCLFAGRADSMLIILSIPISPQNWHISHPSRRLNDSTAAYDSIKVWTVAATLSILGHRRNRGIGSGSWSVPCAESGGAKGPSITLLAVRSSDQRLQLGALEKRWRSPLRSRVITPATLSSWDSTAESPRAGFAQSAPEPEPPPHPRLFRQPREGRLAG